MIEEAAGTRLYESKKEAAQRTIEKKDAKLKEIDTVCPLQYCLLKYIYKNGFPLMLIVSGNTSSFRLKIDVCSVVT